MLHVRQCLLHHRRLACPWAVDVRWGRQTPPEVSVPNRVCIPVSSYPIWA